MNIRNILSIAASLMLLAGFHGAAQADQLADIQSRGVLRVAVPQDYPPFGFVGPDMKMRGYDVEMAQYLAKDLGVKCELVPATGANRIADSRRSLGLGLALCRSIVTAHGGTITVSDNVPHGAVFTFTLPAGEVELHE